MGSNSIRKDFAGLSCDQQMASSSSLKQLEDQLREAANRLMPQNCVDELVNQLDKLEQLLSMVPQAPCSSMRDALRPATTALISDDLLHHADVNVKVSVLSCITELSRISAPDSPYDDDKMKEIFQLTLMAFGKLSYMSGHCYSKAMQILNIVSKVRSSLLMQDLECDDLIVEMFKLFLDIIRCDHPSDVFLDMESIMTLIIEESDDISFQLLNPILSSVKRGNQNVSRNLGEKVLKNCSAILKARLPKIVESAGLDLNDYAEIVHSICHGEPSREKVVAEELEPEPNVSRIEETVPSVNGRSKPVKNNRGNSSKRENNTLQPEMDLEKKKRDRKPNSRLNSEEGYDNFKFGNTRKNTSPRNLVAKKEDDIILSDSQGKHDSLVRTEDDENQKAGEILEKCDTKESGDKELVPPSLNGNGEGSLLNEPSKRKHKRKWTPAKKQDSVTVCGIKEYGQELVGQKVKVWWPLDRVFYEGSITSFDPVEKKHKVLYVDNEQEVLDLNLERWELLGKISPDDREEAENLKTPAAVSHKPRKKKAKTKPESSIRQERTVSSAKRSKTKSSKSASSSTPCTIVIDGDNDEIDGTLEDNAQKCSGSSGKKTSGKLSELVNTGDIVETKSSCSSKRKKR